MDRINRYLFTNFISTFASLFSTLFIIMSIVFFIQIARITSFIEINSTELLKLYLFMLPRILIFTTPIAFFVALTMSLFRLSKENETIVLFTLGYPTSKIAKFFTYSAVVLASFLLFTSIFMIPIAENLKDNFVDYKKTKATLNIKTSQFGQKFSDWLIFIEGQKDDKNGTIYENIVMYYPKQEDSDEKIIIAKQAKFQNINSRFEMKLYDGKAYTILKDKWHITQFQDMTIRTVVSDKIKNPGSILEYWKQIRQNDKRKKDFTIYILVSLFPLATTLYALSFGIVTYRYEKGMVYIGVFTVLFIYFALIMLLAKQPQIAILTIFLLFFISSYIYYKVKIAKRY